MKPEVAAYASRFVAVAALAILAAVALSRWQSGVMDRPLEYDEFVTVEFYTWAGLEASGEQRLLSRNSDLRELSRPGFRQLAMGVYRSLGEWKEPNNHVVHSFLVNFSLYLGSASPQSSDRLI